MAEDHFEKQVEDYLQKFPYQNTYAYAEVGRWNTGLNVPKKNYTGYAVGVIYLF